MARFLAIVIACAFSLPAISADDILVADFDGETYGAWKTTGEAFGAGPARGTLANQMPVSGFLGKGLVNSYFKGDGATGTLTSPAFKIERKHLNFLIGGGGHAGKTCINLLHDGKVVRTATGPNTQPGGSEELDWNSWDVSSLAGQKVVIQIVDEHTGGWGHINVDHIVQSDKPAGSITGRKSLTISKPYLHLPVKTGAPKRRTRFIIDGKMVREFEIELADEAEFHAFADVWAFRGKEVTIEVDKMPENAKYLDKIIGADDVPADMYREKHRPQFHFTSRRGWLNDPNGLVFHDGEWHLFYQHNPYGWNWGNMHWGHAVSKDLVRWRELPLALYPPRFGDWAFSGSAIVVKKGQAGFERDTLVAAFTSTGRGECLTASEDGGRTWKELPGNPVVKHAGRDPKLLWHEPTKRWVMALYDEHEGKRWITFHSSADLKGWKFESRIEGFFECPDVFELPIEGTKDSRWVLYAADGKYVLGSFDGRTFKPEGGKHQLWFGNFYAAQTFNDAPEGRRIQIGWGQSIEFRGMPFNQQMTIPVTLNLKTTADGVRMFAEPVKEVDNLHGKEETWKDLRLTPNAKPFTADMGGCLDVTIEFTTRAGLAMVLNGVPIEYDSVKNELTCAKVKAPLKPEDGQVRLRILVDRGSVEAFANGGRVAVSAAATMQERGASVELRARAGEVHISRLRVATMRSGWNENGAR